MKLQDEFQTQVLSSLKGIHNKIAGIFGIAYLKDRPNIPRKVCDAIAIEDFARIMICDIRIFYFP